MVKVILYLLIGAITIGIVGRADQRNLVYAATTQNQGTSHSSQLSSFRKIQSALSAGPRSIADNATILDWPTDVNSSFTVLRNGSNNWTCLPNDPRTPGNDPICADQQAMLWFQAYMSKNPPHLTQPGIAYMLQGGSDASNTDPFATKPAAGAHWMSAPPHIMIFPVGTLDVSIYGTDPNSGRPWIMWANTPYQHLMIPVDRHR